jgi:membrane protease YdiL (CAAX protease family)
MSTTYHILTAAIVTEGLLVIVSFIFAALFEISLSWHCSWFFLVVGILAAFPLLFLNNLLWRWSQSRPDSVFARFSRTVIVPLCKQVSPPLAVALAAMSGFGEELFFRGVLNAVAIRHAGLLAAALVTSVVFAYVHFVGLVKTFGGMLPIYTAVGLYFWALHFWTQSLFAVTVTHAIYNLCAILWVRFTNSRTKTVTLPSLN